MPEENVGPLIGEIARLRAGLTEMRDRIETERDVLCFSEPSVFMPDKTLREWIDRINAVLNWSIPE